MINSVNLTGRLTRDPEIRETQSGVTVGNFTLAVNRSFTNQNGEREADFINCIVFKKTAEIAGKYLTKGSLIGVTGRLQSRNYENKEGQRVFVIEVVVENLTFLETRAEVEKNRTAGSNQQYSAPQQQRGQAQQSFGHRQEENPFTSNSGNLDISDEDLPF